jgi:catechol-2,3-dioxygenase
MLIREIELFTDDISGTWQFYHEILGLKSAYKDGLTISFVAGRSILTFSRSENLRPVYHFAFNIPQNQIEQSMGWAMQRVELFPEGIVDFKNWNAHSIYFKDNNGNIVELIARHNLNNGADKPFDSDALLSVSEMGIVTGDVVRERGLIAEKYAVPIFSKPPLSDAFTAMGDDEGLFIVSASGRHWYLTDIPAQPYPATIAFSNNGMQYEVVTGS